MYYANSQKEALEAMLLSGSQSQMNTAKSASGEPEKIIGMRGLLHLLPYSDLEQICIYCACKEFRGYSDEE
eukprot:12360111-Ditylum_brightwellii.AAC.1